MSTTRYDRQIQLPGFGKEGQQRLSAARVLVVGAGGLGGPVCQYLNAMGVGTLGIVDGDRIEESNLHRQPLYTPQDCKEYKTDVLARWMRLQNPETEVRLHSYYLTTENALELLEDYDLVVDATDRIPTRYLLDDACVIKEIPWVYGALHGFEGQLSVFNYQQGPTYRCLFPKIPKPGEIPDCNQLGTLGILPGVMGTLQALEVVKIITGLGSVQAGKLLLYNALDQQIHHIGFDKNASSGTREILSPADYDSSLCESGGSITAESYRKLIEGGRRIQLLDVREPDEFSFHHLPGAKNLPLSHLEGAFSKIDIEGDTCLICHSGSRSAQAYRILKNRNANGTLSWIRGGIPAIERIIQE